MIICLIALTTLTVNQESADAIFTKMLNKYHSAKSLKGTITFNQTGSASPGSATVTTITTVQWKQPNFFIIEQKRNLGERTHFLAASDGKRMGYTVPPEWANRAGGKRVAYETAPEGIDGGLNAFAPLLLDRSLPVVAALYNAYEVEQFTKKLRNLKIYDEPEVEGQKVWRLTARMQTVDASARVADVSVPIYIFINKNYDLIGLVWEEILNFHERIQITNQWIVKLEVNAKVEDSAFKLP